MFTGYDIMILKISLKMKIHFDKQITRNLLRKNAYVRVCGAGGGGGHRWPDNVTFGAT